MRNEEMQRGTVLITGATGGFGREFARQFGTEGYSLLLTGRNEEKLRELRENLIKMGVSAEIWTFPLDLGEKNAPKRLFDYAAQHHIKVEILVNNAGFGDFGPFADCDWEKQEEMVQVNVTSLTRLCRLFLPEMLERGSGSILNVSSIGAFQAGPMVSVYYATKAYVLSFTEALAVELKGTGVKVLALCPGPTDTGFARRANMKNSGLFKKMDEKGAEKVVKSAIHALKRGKVIAVPGLLNQVGAFAVKLAPRAVVRNAVAFIQTHR